MKMRTEDNENMLKNIISILNFSFSILSCFLLVKLYIIFNSLNGFTTYPPLSAIGNNDALILKLYKLKNYLNYSILTIDASFTFSLFLMLKFKIKWIWIIAILQVFILAFLGYLYVNGNSEDGILRLLNGYTGG
jgi:hypothetical protein